MTKSIVILDDHSLILTGLKSILDGAWSIEGAVSTEKEFIEYLIYHRDDLPDIAIIDIQLKDKLAFDLIKHVSENYPSISILVNSMYDSIGYTAIARNCGAKGFVSKGDSQEKLINALDTIAEGKTFFENYSEDKLNTIDSLSQILTNKEKTVFDYMLLGKNNSEIAAMMDLKIHTVEKYVSIVYEKLGITHRDEIFNKYN